MYSDMENVALGLEIWSFGNIQKSQENQERLEQLQENIDMENKRVANEQVLLTVKAIRRGMEVSVMDPI